MYMHQNKKKTTEHNKTKFGVRSYIVPSILLHILYFGIFIFTLYTFDAKYAQSNIVFLAHFTNRKRHYVRGKNPKYCQSKCCIVVKGTMTVFLRVLNCGLLPGIIQSVAKTATCFAKIYYFLKFV